MYREELGSEFSSDGINFTAMREPLLIEIPGSWHGRNPAEIMSYPVLYDPKTGQQSAPLWLLDDVLHVVQPNEGLGRRYLVYRPVEVTFSNSPVSPQVGVLLARWYNPALHDRWSTTAAVPPANGSDYKLEAKSGLPDDSGRSKAANHRDRRLPESAGTAPGSHVDAEDIARACM